MGVGKLPGYVRAGDSCGGALVVDGIDTIDAGGIDTSQLGHSYYGGAKAVLSDISDLIRAGIAQRSALASPRTGRVPVATGRFCLAPPPPRHSRAASTSRPRQRGTGSRSPTSVLQRQMSGLLALSNEAPLAALLRISSSTRWKPLSVRGQSVAHAARTFNQGVDGSIPSGLTNYLNQPSATRADEEYLAQRRVLRDRDARLMRPVLSSMGSGCARCAST